MSPGSVSVCVLCGLPAVGKSRLALELGAHAESRGWDVLLVTYDRLILDRQWQEAEWKRHRSALLLCVERFLQQTCARPARAAGVCDEALWTRFCQSHTLEPRGERPLVMLLDDNFYYRSMRHQVQRLARAYSTGFCQVFLHAPLQVCVQRNRQRSSCVPHEVLLQMCERIEPPDPSRHPWEKQSLVLDSSEPISEPNLHTLLELIHSSLQTPLVLPPDHSLQKESDRLVCETSVLHQADLTCRRVISDAVSSAREKQVGPLVLRVLAEDLNQQKSRLLQQLKKEVLVCPVDGLQKLLTGTTQAFQQHTHDVLSRTVSSPH